MKMADNAKAFFLILLILVIIAGGIAFEFYRWQTFIDITDTEMGYFKWKFLIDGNGKR